MGNLKKNLLLGVLVPTAVAALVGYYWLGSNPKCLLLDAVLALSLAAVVVGMLMPTEKKVGRLTDALRALARGERHTRVQPDDLGALSDLGHAVNEVGAFMVEGEDPNLGPIQSKPRPRLRHLERLPIRSGR